MRFKDQVYRVSVQREVEGSDRYCKKYIIKSQELIFKNRPRQEYFERASLFSKLLPRMSWYYIDEGIIQYLEHISGWAPNSRTARSKLVVFSSNLDNLHLQVYPHGDICRKNIIEDDERLYLIDIEPVLEYPFGANMVFLTSTRSCIHSDDLRDRKITIRSDLLGFANLVLWSLGVPTKKRSALKGCNELMVNEIKAERDPFSNLLGYLENTVTFYRGDKN